jgi:SAM-dependent methyltransferase
MSESVIYRSTLVYEAVMVLLYGRHYAARYRALAESIEPGSSVLDVCCGPAILYRRYLRPRDVRYRGLDYNRTFVERLKRDGIEAETWDLREERPLPTADYVVMQASLYHFLPAPAPVVDRLVAAARRFAIVAEPVRNLTSSSNPLVAFLGRRLSDPGTGDQASRFTEESFDRFFARYAERTERSFLIPGGREKVVVLRGGAG